MSMDRAALRRTTLTDEEFDRALAKVLALLARLGTVTNTDVRSATGLNYDQVIRFFKLAVGAGHLVRVGRGSGTRYIRHR